MSARTCRHCGCTDERACIGWAGPCSWVSADMCSECEWQLANPGLVFIPAPPRPRGSVLDPRPDRTSLW